MASPAWDATQMPHLSGTIAVITGANAGIGLATATQLAAHSAHVILACRSAERGAIAQEQIRQATGNQLVEHMALDLSDRASIRAFAAEFHARFAQLDLLVNNAGVMGPAQTVTADGFESHFGVNHLGHFYLTGLLLNALKASAAARVVTVSSVTHRIVSADWASVGFLDAVPWGGYMAAYSVSKLANLMFAYELDRRLRAAGVTHVRSVASHPGITLTNIIPDAVQMRYFPQWLQNGFQRLISAIPLFQAVEIGALPTLFAAVEPSVEGGAFIGPDAWGGCAGYPANEESSAASQSKEDAITLWKRSEELLEYEFDVA